MGRLFGTDGIRGVANQELTVRLAMDIGRAAAMVVGASAGHRPVFLVGKDTRISSDMLEHALVAGLCSAGAQVVLLGVVPTPAVAYLTRIYKADAGVMISASHNTFEYNGIKIFNAQGYKLPDAQEEEIECIVLDGTPAFYTAAAAQIGSVRSAPLAVREYIEHLKGTISGDLSGLRVALDCANGSASVTAKALFEELGAQCDVLAASPDGVNINDGCGSTHMQTLCERVRTGRYDVGLAFDGDADRCLAVDENGDLVDGDRLMAMFAYHLKEQGKLKNNTLVTTVMSNLGLFRFAKSHGIEIQATKVGDRNVLECMLEQGYCIGGEQSGHIIFLEHMTTGDGQLSGVQLLSFLKQSKMTLSRAAGLMQVCPQTLINVKATAQMKQALEQDASIRAVIDRLSAQLGDEGRVLVRASGTEPLIRVMVEGQETAHIERVAQEIAAAIQQ